MPFASRLWSVGRLLLLLSALGATFASTVVVGMRVALRFREVAVPDLIGQSVSAATGLLANDGLLLRVDVSRRDHPPVPPNRIAQQDPASGVGTRRNRAIRVWLQTPALAALVPDLTGDTERTARIRAEQAGLTVHQGTLIASDAPPGTVLAQWPPAGATGDGVQFLVSTGQNNRTWILPDITGLDADSIAESLRGEGLRTIQVARRVPLGGVAGTIAAQIPAAGSPVYPAHTITLEVFR
jgi:beta-lactam-binding protein with PASTA domain